MIEVVQDERHPTKTIRVESTVPGSGLKDSEEGVGSVEGGLKGTAAGERHGEVEERADEPMEGVFEYDMAMQGIIEYYSLGDPDAMQGVIEYGR